MRKPLSVCIVIAAIAIGCEDDSAPPAGAGGAAAGGGAPPSGGSGAQGGGPDGGAPPACGSEQATDPAPADGVWMSATPLPGGPRQETAVVALDGLVYVLGGFTLASVSDLVEVYDPAADSWSPRAPLPLPLHHANAAAIGGKVVVLGFLTGGAFAANGAGFAYDPATDSWASLPPMPAGSERGAAAVGVVGNRVLIAGGFRDGAAVADMSAFDMSSGLWSSLPALPAPRDHGAGAVVDDVFYLVGGREGAIESATAELYAFDPLRPGWCAMSPMPTSRGGISAGVIDGRIVVVGGEGNLADPSGVFRDVEVFDPILNRWQIETPLDVGRHGTAGAVVGDALVVPGGANQQAFGAIASVVVFQPGR